MAKAVAICKETLIGAAKGAPDITTPYSGFVYIGPLPGAYAAYVIVGSGAQLTAIQADPNFLVGAVVTEPTDGSPRWDELQQPISAAARTRINTWRQANGQSNVPAGTTWLQVIRFAANHFAVDGSTFDVFDGN